jgi:restriction endonuclease-like protein
VEDLFEPKPILRAGSFAGLLRQELTACARSYAEKHALTPTESYGQSPVLCFRAEKGSHGNFHPSSYRAILASPAWRARLQKPHTSARSALPKYDYTWRELDSSMSSDALLMNIFCFPKLLGRRDVIQLLGVEQDLTPEFGVKARVPLKNGKVDRTEIDLRLGDLLVESKLTETGFQQKPLSVFETYRDLDQVFDVDRLPRAGNYCLGYQLVRNVLAAFATESSFCVMLDRRRPDLLEEWYRIMSCVVDTDLRTRCKVLTWQELAAVVPASLQKFLALKYGIVS